MSRVKRGGHCKGVVMCVHQDGQPEQRCWFDPFQSPLEPYLFPRHGIFSVFGWVPQSYRNDDLCNLQAFDSEHNVSYNNGARVQA